MQLWFENYRSGDESLQKELRGKNKTIFGNEILGTLAEDDLCQTTRELAVRMNVHTQLYYNSSMS